MKVHSYEKSFLITGALLLAACMAALVYATFGMEIHLPGEHGRIDPEKVFETPPFDNPGVRQTGDGAYEVVIIGQIWSFTPNEIRVPVNTDITFTATSADVIHGLHVEGTRLNMMLIPGQIVQNKVRFSKPGEYLLVCHEYCGLAHHTMSGKVIVE